MRLESNQIDKAVSLLEHAQSLHPDRVPKVFPRKLANFFAMHRLDPKTLILVNKEVTAILVLMVMPDVFSYTQAIKDLVWYSESPGAGVRLLKEAKVWVDGWGGSVHSAYLNTSLSDERVEKLIDRLGLESVGTIYKFKGEVKCQ